ncbi:MAG: 3-phosphoglycerate dehydrogenase [Saprospirales bacterium]|nr:MAG: 3-phosphoglycerate dehydrogenase [Saprospirales bacterium]
MKKILANDGIHADGKAKLEEAGFEVNTDKIAQQELLNGLKEYNVLLVRSATKVTREIMEANPQLKLIGRGGVGLDNIDLVAAEEFKIKVVNTPAASSKSVAELVFGHMFSLARFLHRSNREMPLKGVDDFKNLKKEYSRGIELYGKTLGIVGLGRIGQEVARMGLGLGMNVIPVDPRVKVSDIEIDLFKSEDVRLKVKLESELLENMLPKADFITVHVPSVNTAIIGKEQFNLMKQGAILINSARGGVVDEVALLNALESGKLAAAGLDVFIGEPRPAAELLNHPNISVSPHTGASTSEAQQRIGMELADQIIAFLG